MTMTIMTILTPRERPHHEGMACKTMGPSNKCRLYGLFGSLCLNRARGCPKRRPTVNMPKNEEKMLGVSSTIIQFMGWLWLMDLLTSAEARCGDPFVAGGTFYISIHAHP